MPDFAKRYTADGPVMEEIKPSTSLRMISELGVMLPLANAMFTIVISDKDGNFNLDISAGQYSAAPGAFATALGNLPNAPITGALLSNIPVAHITYISPTIIRGCVTKNTGSVLGVLPVQLLNTPIQVLLLITGPTAGS